MFCPPVDGAECTYKLRTVSLDPLMPEMQ